MMCCKKIEDDLFSGISKNTVIEIFMNHCDEYDFDDFSDVLFQLDKNIMNLLNPIGNKL